MKGIIKLVDIKNPVEGMRVVVDLISANHVATIVNVRPQKENYSDIEYVDGHKFYAPHSQLQQIAIEYRDYKTFQKLTGIKGEQHVDAYKYIMPLSPEDYEKALPLIGQEVEWKEFKVYVGRPGNGYERAGDWTVAKLITPSPIVYTEEEAYDLAVKASTAGIRFGAGTWFPDWWKTHKK